MRLAVFIELFWTKDWLKGKRSAKVGQGKAYGCIFANAAEGKDLPVVIGRAARSRWNKDPKKPACTYSLPFQSYSIDDKQKVFLLI